MRRSIPATLLVAAVALSACGASSANKGTTIMGATGSSGSPKASKPASGTANVAAAGSLEGLVQTSLQPAFEKATGDRFVAKFEGSTAIAQAVKDDELDPGAFVSVGQAAISTLWPSRSRFALALATDPLVVAYSPHSRDAAQLNEIRAGKKPLKALFQLMASPGFRLGRTDPNLDPQGGFFILMVELAEREMKLPAGTAEKILGTSPSNVVGSSGQIVDEDALPTDIASGTYDAGSEYLTEAKQYKLDYITLPAALNFSVPGKSATYSSLSLKLTGGVVFHGGLVTLDETLVLPPKGQSRSRADESADESWLAFLLSSKGRALLAKAGYVLQKPALTYAPGYSSPRAVLPATILDQYKRFAG